MKLFFILFCIQISGCLSTPNSNNDVIGKYLSIVDGHYHYLQFFSDSTYEQVIIGDTKYDTLFKLKGEWKLLNSKGSLLVTNWKRMHTNIKLTSEPGDAVLKIANDKIIVSNDDFRQNFKKE